MDSHLIAKGYSASCCELYKSINDVWQFLMLCKLNIANFLCFPNIFRAVMKKELVSVFGRVKAMSEIFQ